jgi:hypothetical protein
VTVKLEPFFGEYSYRPSSRRRSRDSATAPPFAELELPSGAKLRFYSDSAQTLTAHAAVARGYRELAAQEALGPAARHSQVAVEVTLVDGRELDR